MLPPVIRSGFDTIELAYRAALPRGFLADLARAQDEAKAACRAAPLLLEASMLLVEPSGGQGGYAFRAETGPLGVIWKFREATLSSPWSTHVRFRAHGLASRGPALMKAEADEFLAKLGCNLDTLDIRIARADYAVDLLLEDFNLTAASIIAHARSGRAENFERRGAADRTTYIRVGKQPGKQLCIYSKSDEIRAHNDLLWSALLAEAAERRLGLIFDESFPSNIWRFELRAGRASLDKLFRPRTWDSFAANPAQHVGRIAAGYRYVAPNSDPNRSRWPLHSAWSAVLEELSDVRIDHKPIAIPAHAWAQMRREYQSVLDAQMFGLLIASAVSEGATLDSLPKFAREKARRLVSDSMGGGEGLAERFARRSAEFTMRFHSI